MTNQLKFILLGLEQQKRRLPNLIHPTVISTSYLISVIIILTREDNFHLLIIIKKYCKNLHVKIIFSPFKLKDMFSPKDVVPDSLKSRVVYQFTCASCGVRYIGETNRHFNTRVNGHLFQDKNSHVFKRLNIGGIVEISVMFLVLTEILDHTYNFSQLKIKRVFLY